MPCDLDVIRKLARRFFMVDDIDKIELLKDNKQWTWLWNSTEPDGINEDPRYTAAEGNWLVMFLVKSMPFSVTSTPTDKKSVSCDAASAEAAFGVGHCSKVSEKRFAGTTTLGLPAESVMAKRHAKSASSLASSKNPDPVIWSSVPPVAGPRAGRRETTAELGPRTRRSSPALAH